jgi:hypothetical protein
MVSPGCFVRFVVRQGRTIRRDMGGRETVFKRWRTAARRQDAEGHHWLEAERYAAALQSSEPLPAFDQLPVRLHPDETATMRTIATYERLYPVGSTARWAERHSAAIVATNDRLLVDHGLRGWISFWFADVHTFATDLGHEPPQVTLSWLHDEAPLRLSGPSAPLLSVHVAAHTDSSEWTRRPELQPILTG